MRFFLTAVAVLVLLVPASCGEPNVTDATTTPEQGAEGGGNGSVPDVVEQAINQVAASLAYDQFVVAMVKVVFQHFGSEEGQSTLWIENFGERVAVETDLVTRFGSFEEPNRRQAYWDGDRLYSRDLTNDELFDIGIRQKNMEPAAVTVISPADLESVGYERLGEMMITGQSCEHWRNPTIRYESCFWNRIELLSINGLLEDGGFSLKFEAVEIVEGEGIPDEIRALGG